MHMNLSKNFIEYRFVLAYIQYLQINLGIIRESKNRGDGKMYRLIAIDLDGTLLDDKKQYLRKIQG